MAEKTRHLLTFDGASRSNPGHAGAASMLLYLTSFDRGYNEDGEASGEICEHDDCVWGSSYYIGKKITNNQSEYLALIHGLEACTPNYPHKDKEIEHLTISGDSELVIKQLKGEYQCKHSKLIPLYEKAKRLIEKVKQTGATVELVWIPREENVRCDHLANMVIDRELRLGDWAPGGEQDIAEQEDEEEMERAFEQLRLYKETLRT